MKITKIKVGLGKSEETLGDRFWSKVRWDNPPSGCMEWRGTKARGGYGQVWLNGKYQMAHRISYEQMVGAVPVGRNLDHLCRNPSCVNPDHLEAVDHRTNILRGQGHAGRNARKTHCLRGHPFSVENTYNPPGNNRERVCRKCSRLRKARRGGAK